MSELKVLVPLDGSQPAELALKMIRSLKPLGQVSVRLIGICEGIEGESQVDTVRRMERTNVYLRSVAEMTERQHEVPVEYVSRGGVPFVEIINESAKEDVGIVVMTTHGRTSFEPERLGSVTDKIVRGAACPVLLVGARASVPLQIERITVPLDGSTLAAEALPVARAFAVRLKAKLRLVRAVEPVSNLEVDSFGGITWDVARAQELMASLYLEQAKRDMELEQDIETEVLSGAPAPTLLHDLRVNRPDLVIMTSHGRRGFIRWALGSVTDRIIRDGVPVMVLHPSSAEGNKLAALISSLAAGARP